MENPSANLTQLFFNLLLRFELPDSAQWVLALIISGVLFLSLGYGVHFLKRKLVPRTTKAIVKRTPFTWDNDLEKQGVFLWLANLLIALWFIILARTFFGGLTFSGLNIGILVTSICQIVFIATVIMLIDALLNSVMVFYERLTIAKNMSIKGFIQAIKLLVFLMGFVFVLATILGKSPVFFLSGLGALTAVLLLVFKDAILGFVAGIQISANRMLKMGDWIEMPTHMADGDVIDISLTTVKVQNWDRTITTIPSYELIARPFKNWSGMQESGGRRIKRSLMIDMRTIRFVDEAMIEKFREFRLLKDYIEKKASEILSYNDSLGVKQDACINGRSITNIGTFRAYCEAYLGSHSGIHKGMILLVRQLCPTSEGLPLELYVFTNDTRWVQYEGIQSDIFDHLLAVMPYFGLSVFQSPSGRDLEGAFQNKLQPITASQ